MAPTQPPRPTAVQVFVGLFVVWQLAFLLLANVLPFLPHGEPDQDELTDMRTFPAAPGDDGPLQSAIDDAALVSDCWAQSTGQAQVWSLFAPNVPRNATFPLVELRWHAAGAAASPPVRLGSPLEPADPHSYLRPPGSADRLFHYEVRLGLAYVYWDENTAARFGRPWSEALAGRVARQWKSIRAYLRWRSRQFEEAHPELPPPAEALLRIRLYRPVPADGKAAPSWEGPFEPPLARWLPELDGSADFLPVEAWDPLAETFVRLPRKGART